MDQQQDESEPEIVTPTLDYFHDRGLSAGFHSFSVTHAGPTEHALTQGTVVVEAPHHAPAYGFFTPTGVSDDRVSYTAVFNQPATDEEQR